MFIIIAITAFIISVILSIATAVFDRRIEMEFDIPAIMCGGGAVLAFAAGLVFLGL